MNPTADSPPHAGACRSAARVVARAAVRSVVLAMLLLQVLAPWLHAHVRTAQTVGFHLHLPHAAVAAASRAADGDAARGASDVLRAVADDGDGDAAVMPGAWLRDPATPDAVDADADDAVQAALAGPGPRVPAAAATVASRVAQLDAPRPPPLARQVGAPRAPPLAGIGPESG